MSHRFQRAQLSKDIDDPFRCLALFVIQQAIGDRDEVWLRGNSAAVQLWGDTAGILPEKLKEAIDYWFGKEEL